MSISIVQSANGSDPNVLAASDPSIRVNKKATKWQQLGLLILVIFALCALILTIAIFIRETNANKQAAEEKERLALEVRRINATAMISDEVPAIADAVEDDGKIFFSVFTTPSGADVYKDGVYVGTTPIEQRRIDKSDTPANFVLALDGYEIARKTMPLTDSFSDAVTLDKIVVVQPVQAAAQPAPTSDDGVRQNQAIVVTVPTAQKTEQNKAKSNGKTKKSEPVPVDIGIAIPD